jgi:hypothetical protein
MGLVGLRRGSSASSHGTSMAFDKVRRDRRLRPTSTGGRTSRNGTNGSGCGASMSMGDPADRWRHWV